MNDKFVYPDGGLQGALTNAARIEGQPAIPTCADSARLEITYRLLDGGSVAMKLTDKSEPMTRTEAEMEFRKAGKWPVN